MGLKGKLAVALGLLVLGLGVLLALAEYRWRADTANLIARLRATSSGSPGRVSFAQLEGLPGPVARYFRAALRDGRARVRYARLRQSGPVPGQARDGRLGSLDTLVHAEGTPEIAAGALHRYLAEAAWCPTALLPSAGVVWTPLDDSSARAALTVAATTVWLDFRFGQDGLVASVLTPERARDVGGRAVPTPWQGRWADYAERGGMRVPLSGEVEWLLPEGAQPYWRGRVEDVAYEPS